MKFNYILFKYNHIFEQSMFHHLEQLFGKAYHIHIFDLFQLVYHTFLSINAGQFVHLFFYIFRV